MHKYLDIALGNESNPTFLDDDRRFIGSIDGQLQSAIMSWESRHALTIKALLKCLESAELLKIIPHKHNTSAI